MATYTDTSVALNQSNLDAFQFISTGLAAVGCVQTADSGAWPGGITVHDSVGIGSAPPVENHGGAGLAALRGR